MHYIKLLGFNIHCKERTELNGGTEQENADQGRSRLYDLLEADIKILRWRGWGWGVQVSKDVF